MKELKKILLINTGGTIASKDSLEGKSPELDGEVLLSILSTQQQKEIGKICSVETIDLFGKGIDSSEMTPHHVQEIAKQIEYLYDHYDAFIITHGTDTLSETASLLSFMIQHSKPIIITGSQKTPEEKNSDAPFNLFSAIQCASKSYVGVHVSFGEDTFYGYSVKKIHTQKEKAFIGIPSQEKKQKTNSTIFAIHYSNKVDTLHITTTTKPEIIDTYFKYNDALIIQLHGLGGTNKEISQKLMEWSKKGKCIIAKTKCLSGITDLTEYEVGLRLSQEGILSALYLTSEAAQAKTQWILGMKQSLYSFKTLWYQNFIGEMARSDVCAYLIKKHAKELQLITSKPLDLKEEYLYNTTNLEMI